MRMTWRQSAQSRKSLSSFRAMTPWTPRVRTRSTALLARNRPPRSRKVDHRAGVVRPPSSTCQKQFDSIKPSSSDFFQDLLLLLHRGLQRLAGCLRVARAIDRWRPSGLRSRWSSETVGGMSSAFLVVGYCRADPVGFSIAA